MSLETRLATTSRYPNGGVQRYPRSVSGIPFSLRQMLPHGLQESRGIALDISEGGIGALVQGSVSAGETVLINLAMPGGPLNTVAIVRYHSGNRSGFEFLGLTAEERKTIASVVEGF